MDEVHHLADGGKGFVFLCLGVSGAAVLKDVIKVLSGVGIGIESDIGGQSLDELHLPEGGLGKTVDVAEHVLVDLTG